MSTTTVHFHYRRDREDYMDWRLYIHNQSGNGATFHFSPDFNNPGYVTAEVSLDFLKTTWDELWFKPFRGDWAQIDERNQRFIKFRDFKDNEPIHIYLYEGQSKFYFQKPLIHRTHVTLYYHRHENDFEGWGISYFIDKQNNYQRHISGFNPCYTDPQFYKLSFHMDFPEGAKELQFYVRNGSHADPIDYRRILLKKNKMEIYMIEDVLKTFSSKKLALNHLNPAIIKATFHNDHQETSPFNTLWVETNSILDQRFIKDPSHFSLNDEKGKEIKILNIKYSDQSNRRFELTTPDYQINPYTSKYNLSIKNPNRLNAWLPPIRVSIQRLFDRKDFNENFCFMHENISKDFGLTNHEGSLEFTLWSPTADKVMLNIYDKPHQEKPSQSKDMLYRFGLWSIKFDPSEEKTLLNKFYTFCIMEGEKSTIVMDPYAKSSSINGHKGAIIPEADTTPTGWKKHSRPKGPLYNPIIYELHIKDFTMGKDSAVPQKHQGKYLGIIDKIPYLKKLGVNCVQLLPVTKFASDEAKQDGGGYNWGYDQCGLWFLPEGIYSTDPTDPATRIREFKAMVMALHQNDIRVVIDAVHNHTYETENSILNQIIYGYYYRHEWDDSFTNGSGCGNELKTERPMAGKLIRDYLKYWVREMGIDGFRFDLMSLTDKYTMEKIRQGIDSTRPYILLYGEAYKMGWSILPYHLQASKENILSKELYGIGAFTDVGSRNAIRGYHEEQGLANGGSIDSNFSHLFYIGQKGEFLDLPARNNPTQKVFNYIDIHDDMLLYDNLQLPHLHMSQEEILKRYKLAYSMLFNYIGPIVLKAGVEVLTTKYGDHNSYRSEDVNLIDWSGLKKHPHIFQYFQEYIAFRKAHPAYVMSRHDVNTKFQVLDAHKGYVKGKMFKDYANGDPFDKILIYHNLSQAHLEVYLPYEIDGWALLGDDLRISNKRIGAPIHHKLLLPSLTTLVLCDNKSIGNLNS
jgi:pullulanase